MATFRSLKNASQTLGRTGLLLSFMTDEDMPHMYEKSQPIKMQARRTPISCAPLKLSIPSEDDEPVDWVQYHSTDVPASQTSTPSTTPCSTPLASPTNSKSAQGGSHSAFDFSTPSIFLDPLESSSRTVRFPKTPPSTPLVSFSLKLPAACVQDAERASKDLLELLDDDVNGSIASSMNSLVL